MKLLNYNDLEMILKKRNEYNYKSFATLNGHNIESYTKKIIIKQLKKCSIKNPYNKNYDLLLYFRNSKYSIEVKSCKRYLKLKNGYQRDGFFKFGQKLFINKPQIIVFCIYYRKFREVFFCYGKKVRKFLFLKRKKTYFSLTIKQMKQYLKPKTKIIEIINKVNLYG